jgi:hypothetical protein
MTFKDWKRAMRQDGNLPEDPERRAAYVFRSAQFSRESGELAGQAFVAAVNWAFRIHWAGASAERMRFFGAST